MGRFAYELVAQPRREVELLGAVRGLRPEEVRHWDAETRFARYAAADGAHVMVCTHPGGEDVYEASSAHGAAVALAAELGSCGWSGMTPEEHTVARWRGVTVAARTLRDDRRDDDADEDGPEPERDDVWELVVHVDDGLPGGYAAFAGERWERDPNEPPAREAGPASCVDMHEGVAAVLTALSGGRWPVADSAAARVLESLALLAGVPTTQDVLAVVADADPDLESVRRATWARAAARHAGWAAEGRAGRVLRELSVRDRLGAGADRAATAKELAGWMRISTQTLDTITHGTAWSDR